MALKISVSSVEINLSAKIQKCLGGELNDVGKSFSEEPIYSTSAYNLGSQYSIPQYLYTDRGFRDLTLFTYSIEICCQNEEHILKYKIHKPTNRVDVLQNLTLGFYKFENHSIKPLTGFINKECTELRYELNS